MEGGRYRVEVATPEYWRRQIKCQQACPVHTDARGYVRAIAEGRAELAYLIARGPNPLASICGRVCGAPCEAACRRADYDQAIAIRALKRFVCEQFGPEGRPERGKGLVEYLKRLGQQPGLRACRDKEELLPLLRSLTEGRIAPVEGRSVGVVGSGPAGLAAAHDLALLGFSVTIYEVEPVLGGMLAVGIPHYRLPRDLIQAEVEAILALGVRPVIDCCVGRDVSLPELRRRHDAVVIAVGAKRSRRPGYPGSDAEGVFGGVEFLRDAALGKPVPLGRRIVVVGGGDAAMDAARSALRVRADEPKKGTGPMGAKHPSGRSGQLVLSPFSPGSEKDDAAEQGEHYLAMDAARTASRVPGREVHVVYRRSRAEMPAVASEIEEAHEEGIHFHLLSNPVRIEKNQRGQVRGIWCEKMALGEPDASGRREPVPVPGSEYFLECDSVLVAIGQTYDLAFVDPARDGLGLTKDGRIACDPETGSTAAGDVFVAGDLAHGPKLLIHAVASGKAVARTIYERFTGRKIAARRVELHFPLAEYDREPDYEKHRRLRPPARSVQQRVASLHEPVELGFSAAQARREAGRCFDCGVNTIFDGQRCVLCGGCVDVCPERCLRIVGADQVAPPQGMESAVSGALGHCPPQAASAILKDETRCIRCGLCAERCPTGAITMERFCFEEQPLCPSGKP